MKFVVKIDRASIKENPNAGRSVYRYPSGRPRKIETFVDGILAEVRYEQDIQEMYSLTPEGKWLFSYLPTNIRCESCGAEFEHTELLSDEEWETYTNTKCPKCGDWRCCNIEYEKIEDVIHAISGNRT